MNAALIGARSANPPPGSRTASPPSLDPQPITAATHSTLALGQQAGSAARDPGGGLGGLRSSEWTSRPFDLFDDASLLVRGSLSNDRNELVVGFAAQVWYDRVRGGIAGSQHQERTLTLRSVQDFIQKPHWARRVS